MTDELERDLGLEDESPAAEDELRRDEDVEFTDEDERRLAQAEE